MNTLQFAITINSPKEKVWSTMLEQETFKQWTEAFAEGSYYEGSWNKGEKIRFLTPSGDGLTSIIAENKPFEFISIKHLGIIKSGMEDTQSPASKSWASAFENYTYKEHDGTTEVKIDIEVTPEFESFMKSTWPKALARLKELCER